MDRFAIRTLCRRCLGAVLLIAVASVLSGADQPGSKKEEKPLPSSPAESVHSRLTGADLERVFRDAGLEWQVPDDRLKLPFKNEQPITFVSRNQAPDEWAKLPAYWNETTEKAVDPVSGEAVERKAVKIKVPLGLTQGPAVPAENPMTVARWALGKRLYFDRVLSTDQSVSCASCHDPRHGYTDRAPVSTGIRGLKGGVSAPTVLNSGYNTLQFWDGRALSLEDQAQGPVQNSLEMFGGTGHAWNSAVERVRRKGDYGQRFRETFGTEPTRDAIAKAIACYERTVLSGNSIHDRADLAMRVRVEDEGGAKPVIEAKDYGTVLKEAFKNKDSAALEALGLDPSRDINKVADFARGINSGRALFFGKARCSTCHAGDNFTDNLFHNLGVGVKDGRLPADGQGRFARVPVGHKAHELMGAFKTPTLRGLVRTVPYMHDGSEPTLEKVVEFYDRGGNANQFLDAKMRDPNAERAFLQARKAGKPYQGPKVYQFGSQQTPIAPSPLNLTEQEKKDLVLFLKALQGDPVDPVVADRAKFPPQVVWRDR